MTSTRHAAIVLAALSLGGCANLERHNSNALSQTDDDGYCQAQGGPQGSAAYTACRKNGDVALRDRIGWNAPIAILPSGC